jgi:(S)-citramalyl-CoA lyase
MRSALFVPATRPERFAKALSAGADMVIIDLEDAVEPKAKAQARASVRDFGGANPAARFWVRVNAIGTPWFADDLALCQSLDNIVGVSLPKAESALHIRQALVAGKPVHPIIESPKGALALGEIASVAGVGRLSFGSLDLMLALGATPDTAGAEIVLNQLRCQILLHSRAHGLDAPLEGVYPHFDNLDGLALLSRQVRDMGFGGALCIHPKQIAVIHAAFAPSELELDWARRVVTIARDTGSFAFKVDGKMVDLPVIERARQMLERVDLA